MFIYTALKRDFFPHKFQQKKRDFLIQGLLPFLGSFLLTSLLCTGFLISTNIYHGYEKHFAEIKKQPFCRTIETNVIEKESVETFFQLKFNADTKTFDFDKSGSANSELIQVMIGRSSFSKLFVSFYDKNGELKEPKLGYSFKWDDPFVQEAMTSSCRKQSKAAEHLANCCNTPVRYFFGDKKDDGIFVTRNMLRRLKYDPDTPPCHLVIQANNKEEFEEELRENNPSIQLDTIPKKFYMRKLPVRGVLNEWGFGDFVGSRELFRKWQVDDFNLIARKATSVNIHYPNSNKENINPAAVKEFAEVCKTFDVRGAREPRILDPDAPDEIVWNIEDQAEIYVTEIEIAFQLFWNEKLKDKYGELDERMRKTVLKIEEDDRNLIASRAINLSIRYPSNSRGNIDPAAVKEFAEICKTFDVGGARKPRILDPDVPDEIVWNIEDQAEIYVTEIEDAFQLFWNEKLKDKYGELDERMRKTVLKIEEDDGLTTSGTLLHLNDNHLMMQHINNLDGFISDRLGIIGSIKLYIKPYQLHFLKAVHQEFQRVRQINWLLSITFLTTCICGLTFFYILWIKLRSFKIGLFIAFGSSMWNIGTLYFFELLFLLSSAFFTAFFILRYMSLKVHAIFATILVFALITFFAWVLFHMINTGQYVRGRIGLFFCTVCGVAFSMWFYKWLDRVNPFADLPYSTSWDCGKFLLVASVCIMLISFIIAMLACAYTRLQSPKKLLSFRE